MPDRFWVGGTAAWDGTAGTKWSATSGGPGGASVPTSADDVFFTNLSTGTCTISTGNTGARSINCTGFAGTIAGTAAITVSGSVTFSSTMTLTYSGTLTINGTGTLASGGRTLPPIDVNVPGGTVTLGSACNLGATRTFTLTAGTLALGGFTLTTGIFSSSNSNVRAIAFGSTNIILSGQINGGILVAQIATNFTWTGTTGNEGFSYLRTSVTGAGVLSFGSNAGGTVSNAVNLVSITADASTSVQFLTGSYFRSVTFGAAFDGSVTASYFACGNLTMSGNSGTYTLGPTFLASATLTSTTTTRSIGSLGINGAVTVTLNRNCVVTGAFTLTQGTLDLGGFALSVGTINSSNSNTRSIVFGAQNITLTSSTGGATIIGMTNATGFSYSGTGGFVRSMGTTAVVVFGTTGGSAVNAPNLSITGGSATLTITSGSFFRTVSFVGSSSTVTGAYNACGNLTLNPTTGTYTSLAPTFVATASLTSNAQSIGSTTINGAGITVTLAGAMSVTSGATLTLTAGTFTTNNQNVTAGSFSSGGSDARTLNMGSSIWTILADWNVTSATNLTLNAGTSSIRMSSASAKTFAGAGLVYNNLVQFGAGTLTISGSNTFSNITNTVQPATVTFTAGTTQTVSSFGLSGTPGNLITINSTTPGSQFTLSDPSGTVNVQHMAIQDSNATGGAVWNAYTSNGNINNGNNSGWFFAPPGTGNMLAFFLPG